MRWHRKVVAADKGNSRDDGADALEVRKEKRMTIELSQFETVSARDLFAGVDVLEFQMQLDDFHDEREEAATRLFVVGDGEVV